MICGCRELDRGYIPFNFSIKHYCWMNTDLSEVNMTTCLITGRTVMNQHWLNASLPFLVFVVTGWTGQLKTENVQIPPSELVIGWLLSFMVLISTLLGSESPPHKRRSKNETDGKENKRLRISKIRARRGNIFILCSIGKGRPTGGGSVAVVACCPTHLRGWWICGLMCWMGACLGTPGWGFWWATWAAAGVKSLSPWRKQNHLDVVGEKKRWRMSQFLPPGRMTRLVEQKQPWLPPGGRL